MILGATIESIYVVHSWENDIHLFQAYFTCNRGFSFCMPCGGYPWETTDVPSSAVELCDQESLLNELLAWFGFTKRANKLVEQVTGSPISEILCAPMLPDLDFYDPEGTILIFENGGCLSANYAAPEGIGGGLCYHPSHECVRSEMITFFSTLE